MENRLLPDFLIVGSAKSGTTAIARYLAQHTDVFVPEIKECDFFSEVDGVFEGPKGKFQKLVAKTKEEYLSLYKKAKAHQIKGDISPTYMLFHQKSVSNIKKEYLLEKQRPPKILIILRNPIDRAYSNFMHLVRDMKATEEDFIEEFDMEDFKAEKGWHWFWRIRELGMYSDQVKSYIENFDEVEVLFHHDFIADNKRFMEKMTDFLGIERFEFDFSRRYNESGVPKKRGRHKIIRMIKIPNAIKPFLPFKFRDRLKKKKENLINKNLKKAKMSTADREYLSEVYRKDIKKLEKIVDKDLSLWVS